MPDATIYCANPVWALELDRNGRVSKKTMNLGREAQLTNSLLQGLYPGIHVATVDVPAEPLDPCEQAMVEQALTRTEVNGIHYSLIGASGSAKNGKFYAVESSFEKTLAERFRFSPQAAITYFGILVSSCKVLVEVPDCRVMVVDDYELGTNDCRGSISQSLFRKLQQKHQSELLAREMERLHAQRTAKDSDTPDHPSTEAEMLEPVEQAKRRIQGRRIGAHRFYQFRLAFDKTQAKGAFKVMADEVARHFEAGIILPRSCVERSCQGKMLQTVRSVMGDRQAHTLRGPVMVGFCDVSRNLEFNSSYILLERAPEDSIELEIKPYALSQIEKVRQACEANNSAELFQLLGTRESQRVLEPGEETDPEYKSNEYTVAQAALIADATGYMLKHPFIQHHLQRVLMKWACRLCTRGGFALADDGYLFLHEGQVVCGSDWIPRSSASALSDCRHGLAVRYPIRTKEDFLPVAKLSAQDTVRLLAEHLGQRGCQLPAEGVAAVASEQLQLRGTLVLHSETAARNGGDFDFDVVCLVEDNRFPRFVAARFAYEEQHSATKTKNPKPPSPWWNLLQVSMQARGNQIGAMTDSKTSCLAKGKPDLAQELVDQLQNALDQLKLGTQPDQEVIRNIRNDVPTAPWLKLKQKRQIEDMDEHLDVDANDKVGRLYNFTRKELGRFFGSAAMARLSDFRGVIGGQSFTREIYHECFVINRYYGSRVTEIMGRRQRLPAELEKANAEIEANTYGAEARKQLFFRRNQASAALNAYEKRAGEELKALVNGLQKWSSSKNGTRLSWLSALPAIVCRGRRATPDPNVVTGTGSIVLHSFPQEVLNQIAEPTGGRPVTVEIPSLCDGEVEIDSEGRIFLVQPFAQPNGQVVERPIFMAQVTKAGQVFTDRDEKGSPVVLDRVRKFPIKAGRSEVRNEKEPNEPQPSRRLRSRSLLGFTREGEQRNKEEDMKRIALTLVVLAANLLPAVAQKIGTETSDRTRIVHLKTALNHLTVIEVGEPVVEVAAGSPSFKVEWRENKVFVQPTDADAASNLFIWTATQRLNYELEPAGPVESMDFAVDQAPARTAEPVKPANTSSQAPASPPFTELLFAGRPIRMLPSKQRASKPVEVWISDLYEKDGRLLIRYAVCNHGAQPYNIDTPQVYQLDGVRSPQSLYGFVNWQLGDEQVGKLKIKQEIPVKVLDGRLQSERIAPGEEVVGVVALQVASNPNPTILRLQFPDLDRSGGALNESQHTQIAAFLVR